jgi:sec-independent protein translocase protein TatC
MTPENPSGDQEQSFIGHLVELRSRLLRVVIAILLFTVALIPFARDLYTQLAGPMLEHLPEGSTMVAVEVASPFLTPFKLVLMAAIFLAMPYLLYQIWSFVAPGLYRTEKRVAVPILVSSTVLFYLGTAFAYFVVFPVIFAFFASQAPEGVAVMPDISHYLNFMLVIFFAFGLAFEVPIVVFILVASGVTTTEAMAKKRPYVVVGAFTVGMLLTPPDIISQTLLAIPMWFLFEMGLVMTRVMLGKKDTEESEESAESAGD